MKQEKFHFNPKDCDETVILIIKPPTSIDYKEVLNYYTRCVVCNRVYLYSSDRYERELNLSFKSWTKWHKTEVIDQEFIRKLTGKISK